MTPHTQTDHPVTIPLSTGGGKTTVASRVLKAQTTSTPQDEIENDANRETPHARASVRRRKRSTQKPPGRPENQPFVDALRAAMDRAGLNPSDLARAVWGSRDDKRGYSVAINRDRIGRYLDGTSYPEPENLKRLADALGIPVESLAIERPAPRGARSRSRSLRPQESFATSVQSSAQASGLFLTTLPRGALDLARIQIDRMVSPEVAVTIQQLILKDDKIRAGEPDNKEPELGGVIQGNKGTAVA